MALQTELHRHIDVSARPETLLKLAQERGLESQGTSLDSFTDKLIMRSPLADLNSVLAGFTLFQQVMDRPDVIEQVVYEVVKDCYTDSTRILELRFSPGWICGLSKLKWDDALDGFEAGIKKAQKDHPDFKVGLICIASRDDGVPSAEKTVEFFFKHSHRFIGFDLAGNETDYPTPLFKSPFQKLKQAGANITVHAGEAAGPESVWEAIEILGAKRIGHGIHSIRDPKLMEYLAENQICLEVCPTSNWLTRAVPSLKEHPLPKLLRAGVPVSINTDDPGIFGVTLSHEIAVCRREMGMSEAEIQQCMAHAERASFIRS